ncbi:gustatory receptor 10a [Drosophila grimshawi]|uniref:Gustatory receptor n=1 Tax=Drosophila grimshawi TaxID=7222 RepID=B4JJT4_DROGR|nr:gustatory receptor 10a [Drosophila grimshawi]EDV99836.1 GH12540 [Drosophila grimshawi]
MCDGKQSFWERHQYKFFRYGHIYASIYGQVIIDYVPQQPLRPALKALLIAYSHVFSLMLIVVLPCYFGYNYRWLMATDDRRMQLVLYVSFANTLIKYATVIVTYMEIMFKFKASNQRCTLQRVSLEAAFDASYHGSRWPMKSFEKFMYIKFGLINMMMITQVCGIFAVAGTVDGDSDGGKLRFQFAIYSFVLWNYTENMADYFYYMSSCVLKYLRQLHVQLHSALGQLGRLAPYSQRHPMRRGMLLMKCCRLCDRIAVLRRRFTQIHALHLGSMRMHQVQLLGLMLTTLINNLTNFFTIFNLLATQSMAGVPFPIVASGLYALCFYLDTYIVTLVIEYIKTEQARLVLTMRRFCDYSSLDLPNLSQEVEHFSLLLMQYRQPMLCGLLHLDRRLIYLISVTAFSYFITLVQFDIYLRITK